MPVLSLLFFFLWANPFMADKADEEKIRCSASEIEAHTLQLKEAIMAAVQADSLLNEVRGHAVESDFYEDGAYSCNTPIPDCAECTIGEFGGTWRYGLYVTYEGDRTAYIAFAKLYKAVGRSLYELGYKKDEEKSAREELVFKKVIRKSTIEDEVYGEIRLKYLDVVDKVSIQHWSLDGKSMLEIVIDRDIINVF